MLNIPEICTAPQKLLYLALILWYLTHLPSVIFLCVLYGHLPYVNFVRYQQIVLDNLRVKSK